ncbi:MAG: pitrilysin family protein [Elusimicrobiota bacterium]
MRLLLALLLPVCSWAADSMPAVGPMKSFELPPRLEWRLANGLQVVLIEDHRLPLVTATLAVRSGSSALPLEDAGLAQAMAELLTDGTAKHTSKEISDAADAYGGSLQASAGADSVSVETYSLSEFTGRMLDLLAEVARTPSFPESEVALRKKNMQEELNLQRGESDFLASLIFRKRIYAGHPYGATSPTDASIARLSRQRIVEAHRRLFTPDGSVLVLVGDITAEKAKTELAARFGDWKALPRPPDAPAVMQQAGVRRVYLFDRPGSAQVSLFLGNLSIREDNPRYFDLLLANHILGGSFASRLVSDIRESKGYTYTISSRLEQMLTAALFRVRTPVRSEVVGPALEAIFDHLKRLREKPVAPEELLKAKTFLAGSFARSLETQAGLAAALLRLKLRRLPDDYYDRYVASIQAVTAEGVLSAAQDFIRPDEMAVVAVGDAAKVKAVLSAFSKEPVVPVDQDGE